MDLYKLVFIVLLAMAPGVEARVAIPTAVILGLDPLLSLIISFISSSIPVLPIIYGLSWVEEKIILRVSFLKKIYMAILERVRERAKRISNYKVVYAGLALYVAIPLPLTGVWTGSLIAYLLGLRDIKSVSSIIIGNLIACLIVFTTIYFSIKITS
jgi:uncharacterized membrane protein